MIFDPDKKGPSEFTTRGIITSILFTYIQSASPLERVGRAHTVLGYLRDPEGKEEERPVSFVLETDFRRKRLNLYSGKSSTIKRAKAKELIKCIDRAMPKPDWGTIPHQYVKYKVNVIATYPPDASL